MEQGIKRFLRQLKEQGLTRQQIKTLRGKALAGDIDGAIKGLATIKRQKEMMACEFERSNRADERSSIRIARIRGEQCQFESRPGI